MQLWAARQGICAGHVPGGGSALPDSSGQRRATGKSLSVLLLPKNIPTSKHSNLVNWPHLIELSLLVLLLEKAHPGSMTWRCSCRSSCVIWQAAHSPIPWWGMPEQSGHCTGHSPASGISSPVLLTDRCTLWYYSACSERSTVNVTTLLAACAAPLKHCLSFKALPGTYRQIRCWVEP